MQVLSNRRLDRGNDCITITLYEFAHNYGEHISIISTRANTNAFGFFLGLRHQFLFVKKERSKRLDVFSRLAALKREEGKGRCYTE